MRRFEVFAVFALFFFLTLIYAPKAEYWFQSGARAGSESNHNAGASVEIQTVTPQTLSSGSMAFWTGENLPNGAFVQVGYVIENQTGDYPTNCTMSGCSGSEFLKAGDAQWFFEYFLPGSNDTFLGTTGPDGSAGPSGSFNKYSFSAVGDRWYFYFNSKQIGYADIGVSDSGPYAPVALGELANTSNSKTVMNKVLFSNLSAYIGGKFLPVPNGYGAINYGVGSKTNLANPYGVQEFGTRINYFEVGSGLPLNTNNTRLWTLGYKLSIVSAYGNISSKNTYVAYSKQKISAPSVIYLGNGTRALFTGWTGSGFSAYTGSQGSATITMGSNVTETANWQLQYFVNVNSEFGVATRGTGWYNASSTANYSLVNSMLFSNGTATARFAQWSNGNRKTSGTVLVNSPVNITARWQYRANIAGENEYREPVSVSYFVVSGRQTNSTPFLDSNATSSVQSAYYNGVLLSANASLTANSPTVIVRLPVYNLTVRATGIFGLLPVNAKVNIRFENNTQISADTGPSGVLTIRNVPNGYANVTVSYLGAQKTETVSAGVPVQATFISLFNIFIFILVLIVFAYNYNESRKKEKAETGKQKAA